MYNSHCSLPRLFISLIDKSSTSFGGGRLAFLESSFSVLADGTVTATSFAGELPASIDEVAAASTRSLDCGLARTSFSEDSTAFPMWDWMFRSFFFGTDFFNSS